MGIVSYAQNWEDVLLNRVFGSTHYGFYVDVGAYHPSNDSVTKVFYDRGWDGINVEPGEVFTELAAARPRDINLNMAVYDRSGTITFAQHPGWYAGLSHIQAGEAAEVSGVETRTIPCDTLANILERHANGRPIAFLKIDAEGSEAAIVCSTDWRAIRPTVIVIEATKPRSNVLDNAEWEPVLLEAGYHRAYFDGINCFYVPEERADLLRHFELPVNVLDGSQRFDPLLPAAQAHAAAADARSAAAEAQVAVMEAQAAAAENRAQGLALELVAERARADEAHREHVERAAVLRQDLHDARARLDTTIRAMEALGATQTEAIAAVQQANAYELADLRRQMAELDREREFLSRERGAVLGVRDEALRLRRLLRELRWPGGPAALRAVLPLARLLRRVAGTAIPPVPPEEMALAAPGLPVAATPAAPAAPPPRRSLAKRAAWLAYRPFRPLGRPAALRLRAFLTLQLQSEFSRLDGKLDRLADELARPRVIAPPAVALAAAADPRVAELQGEVQRFGKLLEDTLLTLALEGTAGGRET